MKSCHLRRTNTNLNGDTPMILHVLGSGSSGNCYILQAEDSGQKLMIEAGLAGNDIQKDSYFDFGFNVVGCLLSHEHIDHSRSIVNVARRMIPVYTALSTDAALDFALREEHAMNFITNGRKCEIGEFSVLPFNVHHDAAEPLGFLIHHPECGTICFATDFTGFRYELENVDVWMVECNYEFKLLQKNYKDGLINEQRFIRTQDTHMELGALAFELSLQDLSKTSKIVLLHLSDENSNAATCRRFIAKKTGIPTFIADRGLTLFLQRK